MHEADGVDGVVDGPTGGGPQTETETPTASRSLPAQNTVLSNVTGGTHLSNTDAARGLASALDAKEASEGS